MAMLDELLAQLRNPNQTPWQKQMLGQMMGGPFSPSPTNYGDQMGAPSPVAAPQAPAPMGLGGMGQPQQTPAQAPPRQPVARFPSPGEGTQDNSPPGPSLGTYVSGALAGASQASNPIGMLLGALGGGMAAGQDVENKRGTYQALADAGMDPAQASLAIKNPDAFKMTQALREKQAANRKATDETNRTVRFLTSKHGMTEDEARTIAGNPAALVPYLKPEEKYKDPAGVLSKGYRMKSDGTMEPIPGGPADYKQQRELEKEAARVQSVTSTADRLEEAATGLLNHPGLDRIVGGIYATYAPNIPGGNAANAAADLETLRAQIARNVIQEMRDASKTGGAVGQITEREWPLLMNMVASLDTAQSVDQMKERLGKIVEYSKGLKERIRIASGGRGEARPAQSDQTDGAPAIGEVQDGHRFKGGDPANPSSWEKVQ